MFLRIYQNIFNLKIKNLLKFRMKIGKEENLTKQDHKRCEITSQPSLATAFVMVIVYGPAYLYYKIT